MLAWLYFQMYSLDETWKPSSDNSNFDCTHHTKDAYFARFGIMATKIIDLIRKNADVRKRRILQGYSKVQAVFGTVTLAPQVFKWKSGRSVLAPTLFSEPDSQDSNAQDRISEYSLR